MRKRAISRVAGITVVIIVITVAIFGYFFLGWESSFPTSSSITTNLSSNMSTFSVQLTSNSTLTTTSSSQSTHGNAVYVSMVGSQGSYSFYPSDITVVIGVNNTVVWINNNAASHTVTGAYNSFNSGDMQTDAMYSHTFTAPGVYSYRCVYHALMTGTVTVKS